LTDERRIAEVTDYDGLIAALRTRKAELGLTDALVDELGNLARGHCGKILGPAMVKSLGRVSLGSLLGTLAVKLIMVEDAAALLQMQDHYERRIRPARDAHRLASLGKTTMKRVFPAVSSEIGKRAAAARMVKISPANRTRIARHAARARWSKRRRR
jgi:hypothetical protein